MLARRFTIVCLITALFGMGFSMLVARSNESGRRWHAGQVMSCAPDGDAPCHARLR